MKVEIIEYSDIHIQSEDCEYPEIYKNINTGNGNPA